uniref:Ig-like domain-containing protein n=1 Tax=Anopheles dirus TaxID=7168 RepID=A0A182NVE0_9DIPT
MLKIFEALTLARCLQLTEITVPEVVDVRETVTLSCSYDMGTHKLNSVKWYKDEREFFRYSPMMPKSLMFFDVDGVTVLQNSTVQICNQFMCSIQLHKLNIRSSGSYRCEISGDAPEFKLAHGVGNMTVAGKFCTCSTSV